MLEIDVSGPVQSGGENRLLGLLQPGVEDEKLGLGIESDQIDYGHYPKFIGQPGKCHMLLANSLGHVV